MTRSTLCCAPTQDVLDAVALMVRERIRHVPIVDADGVLVGVVSDRDVREVLGDPSRALREDHDEPLMSWPLADVMSRDPITVPESAPLSEAAHKMRTAKVGALLVTGEDGSLVGMLSYLDLLRQAYG
jgi:acetoin utilization protein AcuB